MEIETIISAITTVGFPIVMCVWLYITQNKQIVELRKTIENNTLVIQELIIEMRNRANDSTL